MNLNERIAAFVKLGDALQTFAVKDLKAVLAKASDQNPWFTENSCRLALKGIRKLLEPAALQQWTTPYTFPSQPKTVGVAMAGNIPLVGFHDFLSVLMAGHQLAAKLSSDDSVLLPWLTQLLTEQTPDMAPQITFAERLNKVDALIATGSDNTARYFEYYFRNIPHIIRKNRSSCAIIMGEESMDELKELGHDVFSYFGLGCRNVSKIYVPDGYSLKTLLDQWTSFGDIIHHHKYGNNYDYQKSILLVNRQPFLDTGFVLLTENTSLVSPLATVYYEFYSTQEDLSQKLEAQAEKIQCMVSARGWYKGSVAFGQAQFPEVWDFADKVDTLQFLEFKN